MPRFQTYNKRINAWVKFEKYGGKTKLLDVKQRLPKKPFKGIKKR